MGTAQNLPKPSTRTRNYTLFNDINANYWMLKVGSLFPGLSSRKLKYFSCLAKRLYPIEYPFPPAEVVEFFRMYFGPVNRAFAALDEDGQAALRRDLEQLWSGHNRAQDDSTHVDGEYLEVIAVRDRRPAPRSEGSP